MKYRNLVSETLLHNIESSLYEALDFDEMDDTNHTLNNSNIDKDLYDTTIKEKVNLIMAWSNDYKNMTLEQYEKLIELSNQYGRPCIKVKDKAELNGIVERLYIELDFVDLNLNFIDTSNVTDMAWLFKGCEHLRTLDVSVWNTSNVTDMDGMFNDCENLRTLDVSRWDTSNVIYMSWMFKGCEHLRTLDVSRWDTSKVTIMIGMFQSCENLRTLDLSNWDISKVNSMFYMFNGCGNLRTDISMWKFNGDCNTEKMLDGAPNIIH